MSVESYLCNVCNKTFATAKILVAHQKTAKYCLKMQGIQNPETICEFCQAEYSTIYRLRDHQTKCTRKPSEQVGKHVIDLYEYKLQTLEKMLSQKDAEISILREQLEKRMDDITDIARQTKTNTTNNTYNHIHHILADGKTFLEMTEPDRIRNMDEYFWQGHAANMV